VLLCFWSCYPIRAALGEVLPCIPLLSGCALFVADFSTRLRRIRFDFLPVGQPLGSSSKKSKPIGLDFLFVSEGNIFICVNRAQHHLTKGQHHCPLADTNGITAFP